MKRAAPIGLAMTIGPPIAMTMGSACDCGLVSSRTKPMWRISPTSVVTKATHGVMSRSGLCRRAR